jgi:hypothetical protein
LQDSKGQEGVDSDKVVFFIGPAYLDLRRGQKETDVEDQCKDGSGEKGD